MRRYSIFLTFALVAPFLVAAFWANSEIGTDYRAMQIAQEQCERNGLKCEVVARPRKPKTDECKTVSLIETPKHWGR